MNYNFTPYPGVIPVNMMMTQPVTAMHSTVTMPGQMPPPMYSFVPPPPHIQLNMKRPEDDKPKTTTTVFVGNILERAPDIMIKIMLQKCGNVINWKRVQGPTGKLPAFGLCEYDKPESTLRCLRLLNDFAIGEQRLLVKVDQKTTALLEEFKNKCRENIKAASAEKNENNEKDEEKTSDDLNNESDENDYLDDKTKLEDSKVMAALKSVLKEYAKEIAPPKEDKAKQTLAMRHLPQSNTEDLDGDKNNLVTNAIRQFREQFKDEDEKMRKDELERTQRIANESKGGKTRLRGSSPVGYRRVRSPSDHNAFDDEEMREKRRQDRRYREREIQYQTRLESWQTRERKRKSFYTTERTKEINRRKDEKREQRRMKSFLEEYDDESMDSKYYKGTALAKRLKEREHEISMDDRDRQREREEIIEVRRRLLIHHPKEALDGLIAKHFKEENERIFKRVADMISEANRIHLNEETSKKQLDNVVSEEIENTNFETVTTIQKPAENRQIENTVNEAIVEPRKPVEKAWQPIFSDCPSTPTNDSNDNSSINVDQQNSPKTSVSINCLKVNKRKPLPAMVSEVFREEDDDGNISSDNQYGAKSPTSRRKSILRPLLFDKPVSSATEKKRAIRTLIESIPTNRSELFAYPIDWSQLDDGTMTARIIPWVNKKIIEYIGEEEQTLTDFICQKITKTAAPEEILEDVRMVLDDEAEVFVVKMWRLIIYESEAKRNGLSTK